VQKSISTMPVAPWSARSVSIGNRQRLPVARGKGREREVMNE
jgi:hypothetical protein